MAEANIKEAVKEIKESDEESLQKVIEDWFERTRTQGLKLGAQYVSAAVFGVFLVISSMHLPKTTTSPTDTVKSAFTRPSGILTV